MSEWTPPGWDWEVNEVGLGNGWNVQAICRGCGLKKVRNIPGGIFGTEKRVRDAFESMWVDHQEQHRPGRALDIEVDWEPSATCSVCPDGGDIHQDSSDTLECRQCGTVWDIDGSGGERYE